MISGARDMNFLAILLLFVTYSSADELILNVNVKKPIAVTSEKFLSLTINPVTLLQGGDLSTTYFERSAKLAKTLAPAYVRFASPESNTFELSASLKNSSYNTTEIFTEVQWMKLHKWAKKSELDVISCIPPQHAENGELENSGFSSELILLSDRIDYNTSWQLGYESQIRCDVSGAGLGKYVIKLRNTLDTFPRYFDSIITGPDVVAYKTKQQQRYLIDYLSVAGPALSAITWHPDFAGVTLVNEDVTIHQDNLTRDKEELYKIIGRLAGRKPLWLGEDSTESKIEKCKDQFLGALVWTRRLGNAAKLGAQVLMRNPADLSRTTPDYWVSLLYKTLVGREVLDTKIHNANSSHVYFYTHCTKPSKSYEKGSLTIFGVNLSPSSVLANLKGIKVKMLHEYILLPGFDASNRLFSETVLLNNETLNSTKDMDASDIKPSIMTNIKGLDITLPSGAIGFWVIPDIKIKSCLEYEEETQERTLTKKTKRIADNEGDEFISQEEVNEKGRTDDLAEEQKRIKKKSRRYEHEEDQEEKKRSEARKYLEILEKVLKRKLGAPEEVKPLSLKGSSAQFASNDVKQPEVVSKKLKKPDNQNVETITHMKTKLNEYKNRLLEYQRQRNKMDLSSTKEEMKITTENDKNVNAEKALEALKLILKIEKGIEFLEHESSELQDNFGRHSRGRNMATDVNTENLEKQLPVSKKVQKVYTHIEENLRSLYRLLLYEKNSRKETTNIKVSYDSPESRRSKRSLEIFPAGDSSFLHKENIWKRRTKIEETKDRRNERPVRRKEPGKREGLMSVYDHKNGESNENNFYGFVRQEPLKGFPQGDVFLTTGDSREGNNDYDYVNDEEESSPDQKTTKLKTMDYAELDDTWIGDGSDHLGYVPNEFYEITNLPNAYINEKMKNYGELFEAESYKGAHDRAEFKEDNVPGSEIVLERKTDVKKDDLTKQKTMQNLMKYYKEAENSEEEDDEEEEEEHLNDPKMNTGKFESRKPTFGNRNIEIDALKKRGHIETPRKTKNIQTNHDDDMLTDFGAMHFPRSSVMSLESPQRRRIKRELNLDDIFAREMIEQDDTNLRDCQCRVNRGIENTNDNSLKQTEEDGIKLKQPETNFLRAQLFRYKRDTDVDGGEENQEIASVEESNENLREILRSAENFQEADSTCSTEFEINNSREEMISDEPAVDSIIKHEFSAQEENEESQEAQSESIEDTESISIDLPSDSEKSNKLPVDASDADKAEMSDVSSGKEVSLKEDLGNPEEQFFRTDFERVADKSSAIDNIRSFTPVEKHARNSGSVLPTDYHETHGTTDGLDSKGDGKVTKDATAYKIETKDTTQTISTSSVAEEKTRTVKCVHVRNPAPNNMEDDIETIDEERKEVSDDATIFPDDVPTTEEGAGKKSFEETLDNEKLSETIKREIVGNNPSASKSNRTKTSQGKISGVKGTAEISRGRNGDSKSVESHKTKSKAFHRIEEVAKAIEARLAARAEAIEALKKANELKTQRINARSTKNIANECSKYQDYQKRRAEQLEKLKNRLLTRREKIMQTYHDELQRIAEKSSDDEKRRRREIWEKLQESDDYQEMVDKEKIAYVLTHSPADYSPTSDESEDSNVHKRYIPLTEMTRPLHQVRPRTVHLKKLSRSHGNPSIMRLWEEYELSKLPYPSVSDLVRSTENQMNSQRASGKVYYSIVDDLNEPRIFEYQPRKNQTEKIDHLLSTLLKNPKENYRYTHHGPAMLNTQTARNANENDLQIPRNMQEMIELNPGEALIRKNSFVYNQLPQILTYENIEEPDCEDDSEEIVEPYDISGKRIYAIDPSSYRGGDPILEAIDETNINNEDNYDVKQPPLPNEELAKFVQYWPQYLPHLNVKHIPSLIALANGKASLLVENPLANAKIGRLNAPILYISEDAKQIQKEPAGQHSTRVAQHKNAQKANEFIKSSADNSVNTNTDTVADGKTKISKNAPPVKESKHKGHTVPVSPAITHLLNTTLKRLESKKIAADLASKSLKSTLNKITAGTIAEKSKDDNVKIVTIKDGNAKTPENEKENVNINGDKNLSEMKEINRRKRRDLREVQDDSFSWIPSTSSKRTSNYNTRRSKYVYLTDDSSNESFETQDRLFKLLKRNGFYKAVPVKISGIDNREQALNQRWAEKYEDPKYARLLSQDVRNRWERNPVKATNDDEALQPLLDVILIPADVENNAAMTDHDLNAYNDTSASVEVSEYPDRNSEQPDIQESDFDTILEDSKGNRYRGKQLTAEKFPHLYNLLKSTKSGSVLVVPWENGMSNRYRRDISNKNSEQELENKIDSTMASTTQTETQAFRDDEFETDSDKYSQQKNYAGKSNNSVVHNVSPNNKLKREKGNWQKRVPQNHRLLKEHDENINNMKNNLDQIQGFADTSNKIKPDFHAKDLKSSETEASVKHMESTVLNGNAIDISLSGNDIKEVKLKRVLEKNEGLTSYVEQGIPKIEHAISGGLKKVKKLTGSVEQLVENFDNTFNETLTAEDREELAKTEISATQNTFNSAILYVKKIFGFLQGITQLLHK